MSNIVWSGKTSAFCHKHHKKGEPLPPLTEDTNAGLRKIWVLDAQWSDCPIEVESQVKDLWKLRECGNDHYIIKTSVNDLEEMVSEGVTVDRWDDTPTEDKGWTGWVQTPLKVDAIVQYIREKGIGDEDEVWIHWWW